MAPYEFREDCKALQQLTFGYGAHVCLGQHPARIDIGARYRELLARVDRIELSGGPKYIRSAFVGRRRYLSRRSGFRVWARDCPLPAVLGHEGSGIVMRVRDYITKIAPGDRFAITLCSWGDCDHEQQLAGRLPFDRLIQKFPLEDINTAIAVQHDGTCVKAVLLPNA